MNPTKIAAILALAVAIAAAGYFFVVLYQNVILLKSTIDALDGIDDHSAVKYAASGGIAVVALIASLALFGSAQKR